MKVAGESLAIRVLAGRVALANKRAAEARQHFIWVLGKDPRNPEALVELGRIEESEGQGAAAKKRYAAALRLRPKDPDLLLLIARAYARGGDYKNALPSGMKAIKLLRGSGQEARVFDVLIELGKAFTHGDKWARTRASELLFEATKPKNAPATAFLELGRLYRSGAGSGALDLVLPPGGGAGPRARRRLPRAWARRCGPRSSGTRTRG